MRLTKLPLALAAPALAMMVGGACGKDDNEHPPSVVEFPHAFPEAPRLLSANRAPAWTSGHGLAAIDEAARDRLTLLAPVLRDRTGQPAQVVLAAAAAVVALHEVPPAVVAALDEVTYVVVTAGRFDMICEVVCEDNEHLLRVLADQLAKIDGIRATETMVELRFVKESYRWGTR